METPCPNVFVVRAIRSAVQGLLQERSSVTLFEMTNHLCNDELIFDLYSTGTNAAVEKEMWQGDRRRSGAMGRLAESLRSSLTLFSSEKTDKNERKQRLDRKYQLMNALGKLKNITGSSSTIIIRSWDEAKAYLESVLDFRLMPTDEVYEELDEGERIVSKYTKEFQDVTRASVAEAPIGLTPAQLQLQKISQLTDVPRMISEHLKAQIEQETRRREQLHQEQLEKIRKVEEEVLRKEQAEEAKSRAAELMRAMTEEEKRIVKRALYEIGPETEIIAKVGTDTCQRGSIQRLQPGEWLNDEVIHHFLIMLGLRDEQLVKEGKRSRRSHFFKSYFMTKLTNDGDSEKDGVYEYRNVKRWSKNVPGTF
jgi:hypothetical protein